jgi:hypothetical protein
MSNRWRQENYFKYAREHFALDALDSFANTPDDPTRPVPNPTKTLAINQVTAAHTHLAAAHTNLADALDAARQQAGQPGNRGTAVVDPAAGLAVRSAQENLDTAKQASRNTPTHLPLGLGFLVYLGCVARVWMKCGAACCV